MASVLDAEPAPAASAPTKIEIKPATPKIKVYNFNETCHDTPVFFQITVFDHAVWIWIGSLPASCNSLAIAMPTKFVRFFTLHTFVNA